MSSRRTARGRENTAARPGSIGCAARLHAARHGSLGPTVAVGGHHRKLLAATCGSERAYNAEEMTYAEALESAFSMYRSGNLQQAYDLTRQITSVATSYAHAFNFLGVLEHERGDIGKSLQAYDKAISLDSTQLEFYTNKGYALKASGRWKETQQIFLHVVEHDPTNKFAWNGLGLAYHYLDQEDKSLAAYDKALVLDPNYAEVYYNKGVSLKYMGDIKEAGVYYWRAIELNPRMHSAIINLAALHQEHGDPEKAMEYFEMLISDDSVERNCS